MPSCAERARAAPAAIRAILFDKDGTLLDYHATWMPVNRAAACVVADGDAALAERLLVAGGWDRARGRVAPASPLAAGTTPDIARLWRDLLPDPPPLGEIVRRMERFFAAEGRAQARAVPGLADTVRALREDGFTLGLATADSVAGARATLAPFGVLERFAFLAGCDSGHGVKPDPGMAHAFLAATGHEAEETAMIGDNAQDMEMAARAGLGRRIGVLTGTSERAELAPLCHAVLDDIRALPALLRADQRGTEIRV